MQRSSRWSVFEERGEGCKFLIWANWGQYCICLKYGKTESVKGLSNDVSDLHPQTNMSLSRDLSLDYKKSIEDENN